jgi:REP element-mobilizing transposase RayT
MSRPLRLEHAGAVWHVTSRGNERRDVFADDLDREKWLDVLARVVDLSAWRLHAYVLMSNHYHLIIETPKPTLSRGMRQLNGVYTQRFNRRHERVGHLFQGRFKAILVQKDSHLLELARYVVLNPVRAGLVRSARNWRWSSYRMTAGELAAPPWLQTDWTLEQFSQRRRDAERRYSEFVAEGRRASFDPWREVKGQIYLGSDEFVKAATRRAATRVDDREIPRAQRELPPMSSEDLFPTVVAALGTTAEDLLTRTRKRSRERALVAYALRRFAGTPGGQIARFLGVSAWRASALARDGELFWEKDRATRTRLEKAIGTNTVNSKHQT